MAPQQQSKNSLPTLMQKKHGSIKLAHRVKNWLTIAAERTHLLQASLICGNMPLRSWVQPQKKAAITSASLKTWVLKPYPFLPAELTCARRMTEPPLSFTAI